MKRTIFAVFLIAVLTTLASAHDYWIEPDSFFVPNKGKTKIRLFVGESLKAHEERPYQASKTFSFQLFSTLGTFDLRPMAEDERSPLLIFGGDHAGTYLLSLERNWSYIKLDAAKFEDYLREEGMDEIIAERAKLGESQKVGRERYSRYIKSIIQVGDARDSTAKENIGSRLEIVPLDQPYTKKIGDTVRFQVYFGGYPLLNSTVFADNRDGDKITTHKLKTDKDGKFAVNIDRQGVWLIHLVHMQRCEKNCGEADWESFWGSLTFGAK